MMNPILVCGVGSIGGRHIQNLRQMGFENIILYRRPGSKIVKQFETLPNFTSLEAALAMNPSIAFICNPTSLHLSTAITCAKSGCHLFIEKPLGSSLEGVPELQKVLRNTGKKCYVGYMMKFHPCIKRIDTWIKQDLLGDLIHGTFHWGEYLPNWHPYEDYRISYAGQKSMGGGPVLTLSHDIDLATHIFGSVENFVCMSNDNSDLEVDTEHLVTVLMRFKGGSTASINLNYLENPPRRFINIVGNKCKIEFDYYQSKVVLYNQKDAAILDQLDMGDVFDRNQLFVDQLDFFMNDFVREDNETNNLESSLNVLKLSLDINDALRS